MAVPELEFYELNWLNVPAGAGVIRFRIVAAPPVAANAGVEIFMKPTIPPQGQTVQWAPVGKTLVDNLPDTLPGPGFQMQVKRGFDYVLRFRGQAHLLDPAPLPVTVGFDLESAQGPLANFNGARTANPPARAAGITGSAYLRCV